MISGGVVATENMLWQLRGTILGYLPSTHQENPEMREVIAAAACL